MKSNKRILINISKDFQIRNYILSFLKLKFLFYFYFKLRIIKTKNIF